MAHYAHVVDNKVKSVLVLNESDVPDFTMQFLTEGELIQTSYNTLAGVHSNGGTPLRKNFAGIGYTYDRERDAFIPPQPYASWTLNEDTCQWDSPVEYPDDPENSYVWSEDENNWVPVS
jgi:hypothetical protein